MKPTSRETELSQIDKFINEHGVRHYRPAFVAPTLALVTNEQERIAALVVKPRRSRSALLNLWRRKLYQSASRSQDAPR